MSIRTIAENRKELVEEIAVFTENEAKYLGAPSFDYKVGEFTIDCHSVVSCENEMEIQNLKGHLIETGFVAPEREKLEIKVPIGDADGTALKNLIFMLHSKQYLLNKAVGCTTFAVSHGLVEVLENNPPVDRKSFIDILKEYESVEKNLGIAFDTETVKLFFPLTDNPNKNRAFAEVAAMMLARAKEAKRINPKEQKAENEKYYLRIWLLRIGMTGAAGKASRKALLEGLKGHTAFRTPADAEKHKARLSARKNAEIAIEKA